MTHVLFTLSAEAVVALEAGDLELVAIVDEAVGALQRRHHKTAVTLHHSVSLGPVPEKVCQVFHSRKKKINIEETKLFSVFWLKFLVLVCSEQT